MKICVVGLGLIGGSICMSLKRSGYKVWGWNRSPKPETYALQNGIIDGVARTSAELTADSTVRTSNDLTPNNNALSFEEFDVVFVALPPEPALDFILTKSFKNGAIVADICGVKTFLSSAIESSSRNFRYVGCHPMAGKEVSTIQNASATLFDGANIVITRTPSTDLQAKRIVEELARAMGFARIVECSPETHDRKIAYTSQLAHVLSNAYVKDVELDGCIGFTGGSFQDVTRIAGVDEKVWASLYILNSEPLTERIDSLIASLEEIKAAIRSGDKPALEGVLRRGRELFSSRRGEIPKDNDIFVKNLK